MRRLADSYFAVGNRKDSAAYASQALTTIGAKEPESALGWKVLTAKGLFLFHVRRMFPVKFFWVKGKEANKRLIEFSHAARRLAELYLHEYRETPMLGVSLWAGNQGNRVRGFSGTPYSYAMLAQI